MESGFNLRAAIGWRAAIADWFTKWSFVSPKGGFSSERGATSGRLQQDADESRLTLRDNQPNRDDRSLLSDELI